jgi:hypothetical protein
LVQVSQPLQDRWDWSLALCGPGGAGQLLPDLRFLLFSFLLSMSQQSMGQHAVGVEAGAFREKR